MSQNSLNDSSYFVFSNSEGSIPVPALDKTKPGGRLLTLYSNFQGNKNENSESKKSLKILFHKVFYNIKNTNKHNIMLVDNLNQIYLINLKKKLYSIIPSNLFNQSSFSFSSSVLNVSISSLIYIPSSYLSNSLKNSSTSRDLLIISYENGKILILDPETKLLLGDLQLPHVNPVVRIMKVHPFRPLLLVLTQDNILFLWNLR